MEENKKTDESNSEYTGINEFISEEVYENLPDLLKTITEPFEGRERDVVLLSSITVLSNCIPNIYGFYDHGKYYPQLYLVIIAPAASGKGVMVHSKKLIDPIHKKIRDESIETQKRYFDEKKNTMKGKANQYLNFEDIPLKKVKIMPANISSTKVYQNLENSSNGLLIFDTEIDTITTSFKQHWGDFSDVLRKAFQHEGISIERIYNDILIEIEKPKLAICFSGTYDQLLPLIKSKNNGLFSRFMMYTFDLIPGFKDVFGANDYKVSDIFDLKGSEIFRMYERLIKLPNEVSFRFSDEQYFKFLEEFRKITVFQNFKHNKYIHSNIRRLGIIMFRICMVLTVIRKNGIIEGQELICDDSDFNIGLSLIKTLFNHLLYDSKKHSTFNSEVDKILYNLLNDEFTRKNFIYFGSKLSIPERTLDYKLDIWKKNGIITQIKQGVYKKKKS